MDPATLTAMSTTSKISLPRRRLRGAMTGHVGAVSTV